MIMASILPCVFGSFRSSENSSQKLELVVRDQRHKDLLECKVDTQNPLKNNNNTGLHVIDYDSALKRCPVWFNIKEATSKSKKITRLIESSDVRGVINHIQEKQGINRFLFLCRTNKEFPLYPRADKNEPRKNIKLSLFQIFHLVKEIEKNKKTWLQEAEGKEVWIRRKVSLPLYYQPDFAIKIDIFSSDRMDRGTLGRIDVRRAFLHAGTLKKVFDCANYETQTETAGLFSSSSKGHERLKTDISIQGILKESIDENPSLARHFVISKSIDVRVIEKDGEEVEKVRFTQTLYKEHTLAEVLEMDMLPNNTSYTSLSKKNFAIDILAALEHLHSKGVLHRDVKSENIFIEYSKELGRYIARLADYDLGGKINESFFAGSPGYVAPEVILRQPTDVRADLYSLGRSLEENNFEQWWVFNENTQVTGYNVAILNERVRCAACYARPSQEDVWNWFLWKMTVCDKNLRFSSAREARVFLETKLA